MLCEFYAPPGVRRKKLKGPLLARSPAAFVKAMREHRIASCAADHGSITVWRDDAGALRGQRHRFFATQADATFKSQAAMKRWVAEQIPHIENASKTAELEREIAACTDKIATGDESWRNRREELRSELSRLSQ